jgi:hypothetical protein
MSSSSTPPSTPEGPGSASGVPSLPAGYSPQRPPSWRSRGDRRDVLRARPAPSGGAGGDGVPPVNSRHCTGRSTPTPNERKEITVNTSTGNMNSGEAVRCFMDGGLVQGDAVAVEELIAHVLCRAHRMAEAFNAPNEARAILQVAHSFADELATTNPRFDRLRFIRAATEDPS